MSSHSISFHSISSFLSTYIWDRVCSARNANKPIARFCFPRSAAHEESINLEEMREETSLCGMLLWPRLLPCRRKLAEDEDEDDDNNELLKKYKIQTEMVTKNAGWLIRSITH